MADGSVVIQIDGDDSKLQAVLGKIGSVAGSAMSGVAAAIGTAGTALAGLGAAAIQVGSNFEVSMAKASTLFGDVNVDIDGLQEKMLAVSNNTGVAASELGEALYSALSAGIPVTEDMVESTQFLESSAKLAKAGFTDIDTALSATAKTLNAYGMGVEETDRVQKIMMQTQNLGITTVNELGASLAQVTPTAAAFGVSFEQVGASLANMTAAGTPTAQATTQLNSLIAELGKSGTTAAGNLQKAAAGTEYAGKSFDQLMQEGVPLNEVLDLMGEYAKKNHLSMVDMFSSIEGGKAALAIAGDNSQKFAENLAAMSTDADVVGQAFDKVSNTLQAQVNNIQNSLENLGIAIYSQVNTPLASIANAASEAVDGLTAAFSDNGLSGLVEELGSVFADAVAGIAQYTPPIVDAAVSLVQSFLSGLNENLPQIAEGATAIVTSLANGIAVLLPQLLDTGIQIIAQLVLGISTALPDLIPTITQAVLQIAMVFANNADMMVDAAVALVLGLTDGIVAALPVLIEKAPEIIENLIQALVENLPKITEAAVQIVLTLGQALVDNIPALMAAIQQINMSLLEGIYDYAGSMAEMFQGLIASLGEGIAEKLSVVGEAIAAFFTETIPQAFSGFTETVQNVCEAVYDAFSEGWQAVADFFTEAIPACVTAIGEWFAQLPYVMGYALGMAVEKVQEWCESVKTFFTETVPQVIESIGTWFAQLPERIGNALQSAIERVKQWGSETRNAAQTAAQNTITGIVAFFAQLPNQIWTWLQNTIAKLQAWGTQMITTARTKMTETVTAVITAFQTLPSKMAEIGKQVIQGIWQGVSNTTSWVIEKIKGWCGSFVQGFKDALHIHSPSRIMRDQVGRMITQGIAVGITAETDAVIGAIKLLSETAIDQAKDNAKNWEEIGSLYVTDMTYGIEKLRDKSIKSVQDWVDADTEAYNSAVDASTKEKTDALEQQIKAVEDAYEKKIDAAGKNITKAQKKQYQEERDAKKEDLNAQIKDIESNAKKQKSAYAEAAKEVTSTYKTALTDGYSEALEIVKSRVQAITKEAQTQYDTIQKNIAAMQKELAGTDLYTLGDDKKTIKLTDWEKETEKLEQYNDAMCTLKEQLAAIGAEDFLSQVTDLGLDEGLAFAEKLNSMSESDFTKYITGWQTQQAKAKEIAEQFYADQLKALEENFTTKLDAELANVPELMANIGQESIQGMIQGMYSQSGALSDAAMQLVNQMLQDMRQAADIHSPSRKMAKLVGQPMAQGVTVGFSTEMDKVYQQVQAQMNQEMSRVSAGMRLQAQKQTAQPTVQVQPNITVSPAAVENKTVVEFSGSLAALGRVLTPVIQNEQVRAGKNFLQGV